jgi:hypothetical protein
MPSADQIRNLLDELAKSAGGKWIDDLSLERVRVDPQNDEATETFKKSELRLYKFPSKNSYSDFKVKLQPELRDRIEVHTSEHDDYVLATFRIK